MKAIIIGGGIGGLTTAIALQQQGIAYQIYEAAAVYKAIGAGILLSANAMNVYEKLGLAVTLRERSCFPHYAYVKDYKGRILQTIDNNLLKNRYGNGSHAIHRATLQATLVAALQHPVHCNKKAVAVKEGADGITVHFADGSSTTGDLLIGADGIWSAIREQNVTKARYRYSGQTCWRAIISMDLPEAERLETAEVWGNKAGVRACYVQVGPGQVYFWFTKKMPANRSFTPEEALALIKKELAPFSGHMQQVIAGIQPETLIHSDLYDIEPVHCWCKGRIVLLGDAAHATTPNLGQGASMAIEDAYTLAACLSNERGLQEAFQLYQDKRIKRAHKIVSTSWQLGRLTNLQGAVATGLRNFLLKHIPARAAQKQLEFLYGGKTR